VGSGFKDLKIWQIAKDLSIKIYQLTSNTQFSRDYGLRDQIRRSAVSIASNIAEGDERGSNKEAVRFFFIAKGSLAEIRTQLQIALEIGYFDTETFNEFDSDYEKLGSMIGRIIKARK